MINKEVKMNNKLPIKINLSNGFLDDEIRCGHTITSNMKALWAVELDLLDQLDKVCKQNKIKYFACAGTMLGAVRHNGIIPWDDDIDVMIFRDDYKKLCKIAEKEFHYPYFFQTEYNDPGSIRGHAQLRNSETTAILNWEEPYNLKINQGVFIDIYPLDNVPDSFIEREEFRNILEKLKIKSKRFASLTSRYYPQESYGIKKITKKFLHPFMMIVNKLCKGNYVYKKYDEKMQIYNTNITKFVGILALYDQTERFIWRKKDLESQINYVKFEMMKIPVPSNYDNILTKTYGKWHIQKQENAIHDMLKYNPYKTYRKKSE